VYIIIYHFIMRYKLLILTLLSIFFSYTSVQANLLMNQQLDSAIQRALNGPNANMYMNRYMNQTPRQYPRTQKTSQVKKEVSNPNDVYSKDQNTFKDTKQIDSYYEDVNEDSVIEKKLNHNTTKSYIEIPNYYNASDSSLPTLNKTTSIKQFGYDIFESPLPSDYQIFYGTQPHNFLNMNIPVNDDYILGVGDQLIIRIWGKVEQQIEVSIDNNGTIFIPKIGNIFLSGTSFKNAHKTIKSALEKHYVNFELSITMGNLKTIKVFILGEVNNPGSYDISSLSTLFTALHLAGGPSKRGTLRNIQLKRNNKTIKVIDLYQYLLSGNNSHDQTLKNFDTIFVPPIGSIIKIDGDVKRPAIYELNGKTSLYSAINKLAGGVWGTSDQSNIALTRVEQNKHKTLLNIETTNKKSDEILKNTLLKNNDEIIISSILEEEKNTVRIIGSVKKPGTYAFKPSMSFNDLLEKAKGFTPKADKSRIKLFRYVSNNQKELIILDLEKNKNALTTTLNDWDIIEIDETINKFVSISGAVINPGTYQRFENISVYDLIKLAMLKDTASMRGELIKFQENDTNKILQLDIKEILSNPESPSNIILSPNDKIFIPENPKLANTATVTISGEVNFPGTYVITEKESLNDIITRAGGLTEDAYLEGLELNRKSLKNKEIAGHNYFLEQEQKRVLFNQEYLSNQEATLAFITDQEKKARGRLVIDLKNKESLKTTVLEPNDTIIIPKKDFVIPVIGGVQTARGVLYKTNKKPNYYIKKAGGRNQFALKRTVYVFKHNGVIQKNPKKIEPGDTIYIPQEVKESWTKRAQSWNLTIQIIASTLQTVILLQSLGN
jgi:protein involved in polysaccharide export with SLBB domain